MFRFNVGIPGDFDKVVEAIGATEAQVRTAAVRALNKTALWLRSQSAKEISDELKIKMKLIRQKFQIIKASKTNLEALVVANLYGFKAVKLGTPKQTASGVSIGKHKFPGAFVAKMPKTGHVGVFKRKNRKRLPIREQYFFLDPEAYEIVKRNVDNEASAVFLRHFEHEIHYATQ
jgi:hypothetical protein